MADEVRNHFHLWAVGGAFTGTQDHEYRILLPGIRDTPRAIAAHSRSLNGKSHLHVLVDGGGDPVLVKDVELRVLATRAQRNTLAMLQGKRCYYIPITHMGDSDPHDDGGDVALPPGYAVDMLAITDDQNVDPMLTYWTLTITLKDDSI